MLVWRKGNINKNCLCYIIVYYYNGAQIRAVLTGRLTVSAPLNRYTRYGAIEVVAIIIIIIIIGL